MTRPVTTPGRLVAGRYRLQSQLGGGGMGTVWLARDELLGRQVAVKQVLTPVGISAADADQQRQRALREGRIAARLSHPHAISVYDVALEAGQPWLVMEYLPSRSLAAVLSEDGVLRVDQVAQVGAQAFLAPEVAQGHDMTEASDVFSLGATLYTCLEGQPPFGTDENALRLLHRVAGGELIPPRRAGSMTAPRMRM